VSDLPTTRFAKSGDLGIAYQELGSGPIDLVIVPQIVSHLEVAHEIPGYTAHLEALARFAHVVTFDKRGTGMSDRPDGVALLEERVDDLLAVMDATKVERCALMGVSEGGTLAVAMAAQHPERVSHLILCGTAAWFAGDPDEGAFMLDELVEGTIATLVDVWGNGDFMRMLGPSGIGDPRIEPHYQKMERYSTGPRGMGQLMQWVRRTDVRALLPAIKVPTLVLRRSDEIAPRRACEYLAEHIDGARYLEVPGVDHLPWLGDGEPVVAAIEEFVTGTRSDVDIPDDTVLATVLFTDIVGSTEQAAKLGDRRWRQVLDAHDEVARREVERHRGRVVQTTGDGILASFDGPARGIRCARAITSAAGPLGLRVRSGLHTGECEVRGDDLAGLTVHIGSRVAALADAGEVLVTSTVRDLVIGADFEFRDRGEQLLKGVPGMWRVLAVAGGSVRGG
jgi:class 3 adenylate cyclase/pimeloyl-ACP methyl ester carboxylesterase